MLPVAEIHDWPSLAYRGTMVDISHGPLPTENEIERQIDFLSRWKANQYFIYNEDSIELFRHPLLNPEGRLSQKKCGGSSSTAESAILMSFRLLICMATSTMYSDWSNIPRSRIEPHGTEFDPRDPKTMPLLSDWASQFADLFPSPFVSIGFDEVFQIDAARGESGFATDPTALFVKQLAAVSALFQKHQKHVMAYGDMLVKYPDIISYLPSGLIAVAWHSTPEDPTYKHWLGPSSRPQCSVFRAARSEKLRSDHAW